MVLPQTQSPELPPIVLIVEDDEDTREMYKMALEMSGFLTSVTAQGEDAIAFAEDMRPDAILTDIGLGPSTGVDLARQLKTNVRTARIPILAVTGWDPAPLRRMDRLFEDVMLKPVDPSHLIERLRDSIRRSAELRRRAERARAAIPAALEHSNKLIEKSRALKLVPDQPPAPPPPRGCPRCDHPLNWLERRQVNRVFFDYYAPCGNGCGLFCYDNAKRSFVTLIG